MPTALLLDSTPPTVLMHGFFFWNYSILTENLVDFDIIYSVILDSAVCPFGFSELRTALLSRCSSKKTQHSGNERERKNTRLKKMALETAHSCLFHNPPIHKQNIVYICTTH